MCNTMTNKSEDFYVISDNGTTVTALAKYDLLVGNTVVFNDDFSDMTSSPISTSEEGFGLQNNLAGYVEWGSEDMPLNHTIKGVMTFSESRYWVDASNKLLSKYGTSETAYVFDSNSNLYKPLENYKTYLKGTLGKTSVDVKLMTYENLISLGCKKGNSNSCTSAPSWVYNINYWTGSQFDSYNIFSMDNEDGSLIKCGFNDMSFYGLRPVITIKKSEI